jgi:mannose-6-phosphate isomerase-like protein (cupin superfamily)
VSGSAATAHTVIPPDGGDVLGFVDGVQDRFLVESDRSGGAVALVEHRLAPRTLAAPVHLHEREDEYSYVLEGRIGVLLGDHEVVVEAGGVLVKPRGQWHTFWNPDDRPARVLEVIVPAGIEELFRLLDGLDGWPEPDELARLARRFGARLDIAATTPIAERHDLNL